MNSGRTAAYNAGIGRKRISRPRTNASIDRPAKDRDVDSTGIGLFELGGKRGNASTLGAPSHLDVSLEEGPESPKLGLARRCYWHYSERTVGCQWVVRDRSDGTPRGPLPCMASIRIRRLLTLCGPTPQTYNGDDVWPRESTNHWQECDLATWRWHMDRPRPGALDSDESDRPSVIVSTAWGVFEN